MRWSRIPAPGGDRNAPLKAMLVDSWYDPYLGVVILVRVIDGVIKKGLQVKFMAGGTEHLIDRVGCMRPKIEQLAELGRAKSASSPRRSRKWRRPAG
jgi:GTP-binding protein LepA